MRAFEKNTSSDFIQSKSPFFSPKTIQPKLSIGKPNDKYEQEADAMASQVVNRMSQNNSSVQTKCPECEAEGQVQRVPFVQMATLQDNPEGAKDDEILMQKSMVQREEMPQEEDAMQAKMIQREEMPQEEDAMQAKMIQREEMPEEDTMQAKMIQREEMPQEEDAMQAKMIQREEMPQEEDALQAKSMGNAIQRSEEGEMSASSDFESRLQSSQGGGSPLPENTRSEMESSFGSDFSNVKVHTGSNSVQMNQDIGAKAFTHQNHIHFNQGQYNPDSSSGKELLAHELTHTIQQGASPNLSAKEKDK